MAIERSLSIPAGSCSAWHVGDRVVQFAESGADLSVRNALLVVRRPGHPEASIPLVDIAVVITAHPQVRCTQAVLAGLSEHGASLVACGADWMPTGMLLPLSGNAIQSERMAAQATAARPLRKRLWREIVRAKIRGQETVLRERGMPDPVLLKLADKVRSGDPANVEAQAARRYWGRLFPEGQFRREREGGGANPALNYGYAVLRAAVARAICAAGLHPSLPLHHHNRYDNFPLASDLVEPFRPLVDRRVATLVDQGRVGGTLDTEARAYLLEVLFDRVVLDGASRSLFDASSRVCTSLVDVLMRRETGLKTPDWRAGLSTAVRSDGDEPN